MAKWVVVVESNCGDPKREAEFNRWYNDVHVPDVLETPGVVRASRYEAVDAAGSKYLALYEIEANDLQAVMKAIGENLEKKRAQGRMSDLLKMPPPRSYRQIFSLSARK